MRVGRIVRDGQEWLCEAGDGGVWLLSGVLGGALVREGTWLPEGTYRLLSPVEPAKILVILGGFPRGVPREEARQTPPRFAAKLTATVIADGQTVVVPHEIGSSVMIEPELAVVIGAPLRRCSPSEAGAGIFGFTCFNDVSAAVYLKEFDFLRAKSIDTFGPMGPWIVTDLTEQQVADGLAIRGFVNGELVQTGTTKDFTHTVGEVISEASRYYSLQPGDLISLGTPPNPVPANVGDTVTVEVEAVGTLTNAIAAEET